MKLRITTLILGVIVALGVFAPLTTAQTKPTLSGTWKLIKSKSKFDGGDAPQDITIKFTEQGDRLQQTLIIQGSDSTRTFDLSYTIDGKEGANQLNDETIKTTARWEGNMLNVSST